MRSASSLPRVLWLAAPWLTWTAIGHADPSVTTPDNTQIVDQRINSFHTVSDAIDSPADLSILERFRFAEPFNLGPQPAAKSDDGTLSQLKANLRQFLNDSLVDAVKISTTPGMPLVPVTYAAPMDEVYRWMLVESTFGENTRIWPAFRAALAYVAEQKNLTAQFDDAWPRNSQTIDFSKLKNLIATMAPGPRVISGTSAGSGANNRFALTDNVAQNAYVVCDGRTISPARDADGQFAVWCAGALSLTPKSARTDRPGSKVGFYVPEEVVERSNVTCNGRDLVLSSADDFYGSCSGELSVWPKDTAPTEAPPKVEALAEPPADYREASPLPDTAGYDDSPLESSTAE